MMTLSGTMQPPNIKPRHGSHTLWVRHIALLEQASEPPADIDGVEKVLGLWESWVFVQYPAATYQYQYRHKKLKISARFHIRRWHGRPKDLEKDFRSMHTSALG
jgi:hypothetical protein